MSINISQNPDYGIMIRKLEVVSHSSSTERYSSLKSKNVVKFYVHIRSIVLKPLLAWCFMQKYARDYTDSNYVVTHSNSVIRNCLTIIVA